MASKPPVLEVCNINKSFHSVPILRDVSFALQPGEVCAILGENGAGKSVLMKILIGLLPMDSGVIRIDGSEVQTYQQPPQKHGIHATLQGKNLVENMTVASNLFLYREVMHKGLPVINKAEINERARAILGPLSSEIEATALVGSLDLASRKLVEICKAFAFHPKVVILDETTAPLEAPDIHRLFRYIRCKKQEGVGIIFISHNLDEVMQVADRILVLNHGELIQDTPLQAVTSPVRIVEAMAGRDLRNRYPKIKNAAGPVLFEARGIGHRAGGIRDVSFCIRSGEIVGLAGLQGAGKTSLAKLMFGIEQIDEGDFFLDGKPVSLRSPGQALERGIAYVSNDVQANVFMNLQVWENIQFLSYKRFMVGPFVNFQKLGFSARQAAMKFRLRLRPHQTDTVELSMGTLQKLVISRWSLNNSRLFILNDPAQQLDIPSKLEVYNMMNKITADGKSILLISTDIDELVGMCDRILVIRNGRIVQEMDAEQTSSRAVLQSFYGQR